ncbi:hypothetical protein ACFFOU_18195 [Pseudonocardia sulfidoxydans]|uniref:hypothetical protein n=1 Tax=Pseudonocardia sulfidoxydans TaxID=54011 RepID=UPI0016498E8F|nr:hypothetical protein [Pseudonocardia sulfidoxydans]
MPRIVVAAAVLVASAVGIVPSPVFEAVGRARHRRDGGGVTADPTDEAREVARRRS